jgi:hypothetical protein
MKFTVLRDGKFEGELCAKGDVIDVVPSLRTQQLVDLRYLLPADAAIAAVAGPTDTPKRGRLPTRNKD